MKFYNLILNLIWSAILIWANLSIGIKFIDHPEKWTVYEFKWIGVIFILWAFTNLINFIKKIQEYEK